MKVAGLESNLCRFLGLPRLGVDLSLPGVGGVNFSEGTAPLINLEQIHTCIRYHHSNSH